MPLPLTLIDAVSPRLSRQSGIVGHHHRVAHQPMKVRRANASENDLRACFTQRRISGGTMSADGRQARDVMLGSMKTCQKLGISFFTYLGTRLGLKGIAECIPPLPDLVSAQPT